MYERVEVKGLGRKWRGYERGRGREGNKGIAKVGNGEEGRGYERLGVGEGREKRVRRTRGGREGRAP